MSASEKSALKALKAQVHARILNLRLTEKRAIDTEKRAIDNGKRAIDNGKFENRILFTIFFLCA